MNPKSEPRKLVLAQEPYSGAIRYKFHYKVYIVDFYSTEQVLGFVGTSIQYCVLLRTTGGGYGP